MATNHSEPKALLAQLHQLLKLLADMDSLLEQEKKTLRTIDPESLNQLTQKKSLLARELANAERIFTIQLEKVAAESKAKDLTVFEKIERAIDNAAPEWKTELSTAWQDLLNQAAKCKQKNLVNGIAIHTGLQTTQKITRIFQPSASKTNTYDKQGKIES